ncbi:MULTISPECIES: single-stranded DNA-binding protein [Alphaproteobacteria]
MNYNKVIVSGHLVRDPEGKALPSGSPLTTFSVASNRTFTKDGEKHEEVEYHNIVIWGKLAENCAKALRKGSAVLVEGRLQTRSWEHEGTKHYRTEIVAERVIFGPKSASEDGSTSEESPDAPQENKIHYPTPEEEGINPEDIPF